MPNPSQTLPPITPDVDQAIADLKEFGICMMSGVLTPSQIQRAQDALAAAAQSDLDNNRRLVDFVVDTDNKNQRVWNLLSRDPVFTELAENPTAMVLLKETLGWPALLSNLSGNINMPGAAVAVAHCDQPLFPEHGVTVHGNKSPMVMNIAWCIDDFTEENGATEVVVGSHRETGVIPDEDQYVKVTAPAGTLIGLEGRTWHRAGANTSRGQQRRGVFGYFTIPRFRPQENWLLSLDEDYLKNASDDMLTLLAYKTTQCGMVYGVSPDVAIEKGWISGRRITNRLSGGTD